MGGRGRYRSIAEALAAAQAGSRIMVEPGVYKESLEITKPMQIIGQGGVGKIKLEARNGHVVWFRPDSGRIANLTIRQTGTGFLLHKLAGEFWCGVSIDQGQIAIEVCDISSQSGACVRIGSGASAQLRGNRTHSGKAFGVVVADNAGGILEDNDIYDNPSGVLVGDSIPTLQRNRIRNNREHGLLVGQKGRGLFTDNEVSKSSWGICILKDGDPTRRNNRVHDCQAGVAVMGSSRGTLEDNDIYANAVSGGEIIDGGDPSLRGNRIYDNKQVADCGNDSCSVCT